MQIITPYLTLQNNKLLDKYHIQADYLPLNWVTKITKNYFFKYTNLNKTLISMHFSFKIS